MIKLALGVARQDPAGVRQLLHYQPGVGTGGRFDRLAGGALGIGLSRNVRHCYRFLVDNYDPGDEIYLFGFSRGAFTARSIGGLIRNSGILEREHADRIGEAYEIYRARGADVAPSGVQAAVFRRMYSREARVHLIGVWDTVGSLGVPASGLLSIPAIRARWEFHDVGLSSHVRHAYHALAIDEHRGPFEPTLWEQAADARDQTLEQVWFAGAHCDVGGGYREPELAEIALLWMVDRAAAAGLAFDPSHFRRKVAGEIESEERRTGAAIAPDALGALHDSSAGRLWKWMDSQARRLDDPSGSRQSLASSVARRHASDPGYRPQSVEKYLAAGGPQTHVRDGGPATRVDAVAGAAGPGSADDAEPDFPAD